MKLDQGTTVVVLGHEGMLGNMVVAEWSAKCKVVIVTDRYVADAPDAFFRQIVAVKPDVVINAIGAIKQRVSDASTLLQINALLPLALRRALPAQCVLIQPSTDCVFDGARGDYLTTDAVDAADVYGQSKALGEAVAAHANTYVVRTSLIGPETPGRAAGLLSWFLSQKRSVTLSGFTNHRWNGLTTLAWTQFVEQMLADHRAGHRGLTQPGTSGVSTKFEMLKLFAELLRPDLNVLPVQSPETIDRSLRPTNVLPPLRDQMLDLVRHMTDRKLAS